MSYWQFVVLFLALPMSLLLIVSRRWLNRRFLVSTLLLIGIALIFTVPMDNYAISQKIWSFDAEKLWKLWLLSIPLEEYLFYLFWIIAVSLLSLICWRGFGFNFQEEEGDDIR